MWEDQVINTSIASGSQDSQTLLGTLDEDEALGMTVTRILVSLYAMPLARFVARGEQALSLGIGIIDREAFGAGVLPDPETSDDQPIGGWMFRERLFVRDDTTTSAIEPTPLLKYDLKGQRKVGRGIPTLTSP